MRFLQSLLMAPGPFYFYPWKPVVNAVAGDSYDIGFKHFWSGHRHLVNLALHTVCLFVQVFGNFGLLHELDAAQFVPQPIPGVRLLSASSAVLWSVYLVLCAKPAPLLARVLPAGILCFAYLAAPHFKPQVFDLTVAACFLSTLVTSNLLAGAKRIPAKGVATGALAMLFWSHGWPLVQRAFVENAIPGGVPVVQESVRQTITLGVLVYLFAAGLLKNPLKLVVISGLVITRLAAAACGGDLMLFYLSYAFAGSLMQGITHAIVGEEATLLALERQSEEDKVRFEYSHVTFFPTLLLHALLKKAAGKQ